MSTFYGKFDAFSYAKFLKMATPTEGSFPWKDRTPDVTLKGGRTVPNRFNLEERN